MLIKPIDINEFPKISSNCVAFALGICEPVSKSSTKFNLDENLCISDAFIAKVKELGFADVPRQISSIDELHEGEFAFMVFDFSPHTVHHPFVGPITCYDFHVVRRELDGSWVHKPGWDDAPCKVQSDTEWEEIFEEFGREYVLFAI